METYFLNGDKQNTNPTVLACGFFDGLHVGHQSVFDEAKAVAKEDGLEFSALTFSRSPKAIITGVDSYITILTQRLKYFEQLGVQNAFVYEASLATLMMDGESFINLLIRNNVKTIVCGTDFKFGAKGSNTWEDITELSKGKIEVRAIEFKEFENSKISSSTIIKEIEAGNIDKINHLLFKPYNITGTVVKGKQLGRQLGFPTANVMLDSGYAIPKHGVYQTMATIDGKAFKAITNIGVNPTTDCGTLVKAETHIIDFNNDIYGQVIGIRFIKKIRDEKKFDSVDDLKKQISKDVEVVKKACL